jgi:hypothetical protein
VRSLLEQQALEDFWVVWPDELQTRWPELSPQQARTFCGMALRIAGSIERARQALGNVRESDARAEDIPRYLRVALAH